MKQYEFHPIAKIFPLDDDGPDFDAFVEDIRVKGLQQPIVLLGGKILDGRRRYLACKEAAVSPNFGDRAGMESPLDFVVSVNLHRRHLTPSQRAAIGLKLLEQERRKAKDRQRLSNGRSKKGAKPCATLNGKATQWAAQQARCSARLIEQIKYVQSESPGLIPIIAAGKLTVANAVASLKPQNSLDLNKTKTPPSVCYWIWKTIAETGFAPSSILDPAAGSGNLTAPFRTAIPKVRIIEFEINRGKDFRQRHRKIECDLVICNPPFDRAAEFMQQIAKLVDTSTPIVFVAPISSVIGFQEKTWHALLRSSDCPRLTSITPLPTATFVAARTPAVILWFNLPSVQSPLIPDEFLVRSNEEFVPPTCPLGQADAGVQFEKD